LDIFDFVVVGEKLLDRRQQPAIEPLGAPSFGLVIPHRSGQRSHQHGLMRRLQAVFASVALHPLGGGYTVEARRSDGLPRLAQAQQLP
jgi:hypothetical protein